MSAEKEVIKDILLLYKDMPYLWDKSDPNYMNKNIRNEGYNVLLGVYKSFDQSATIKTLKKKIDNLRGNYQKELKKVKASKHTGAGTDDVYQPTIWYYDYLSFLESTTTPCRRVRDTLEHDEDSSLSSTEVDTQPTTSTANTSNRFKKKKKGTSFQQEILEKASGLLNSSEQDWEIMGKSIGLQLKKINNIQQHAIAQKLISEVIFYGIMNKLSENTVIDLRTSSTDFRATARSSVSPSQTTRSSFGELYSRSPFSSFPSPLRIQSPHPSPVLSPQYQRQISRSPLSPHRTQSPHPSSQCQIQFSNTHQQSSHASPQNHVQSTNSQDQPASPTRQTILYPLAQYHVQPSESSHYLTSSAHQQSSHASKHHYHSTNSQHKPTSPTRQTISYPLAQYHAQSSEPPHYLTSSTHQQSSHASPQNQVKPASPARQSISHPLAQYNAQSSEPPHYLTSSTHQQSSHASPQNQVKPASPARQSISHPLAQYHAQSSEPPHYLTSSTYQQPSHPSSTPHPQTSTENQQHLYSSYLPQYESHESQSNEVLELHISPPSTSMQHKNTIILDETANVVKEFLIFSKQNE